MKVIFPISESDLELSEAQTNLIKALGGVREHEAVILPSPLISHKIKKVRDNLEEAFHNVGVIPVKDSDINEVQKAGRTHIYQANQMFQLAVRYLAAQGNTNEWYWFEPDCTPLKESWLDELAREYLMSAATGALFLGVRIPRVEYVLQDDGSMVPKIPDIDRAPMMVGTGIYPYNLHNLTSEWRHAKQIPFDFAMGDFIFPKRGKHTNKIVHNLGTAEYIHKEGNIFSCKNIKGSVLSREVITIGDDAVVLHGCKDTTMIDYIYGKFVKKPKAKSSQPNTLK